jgi:hypothetical protein
MKNEGIDRTENSAAEAGSLPDKIPGKGGWRMANWH